MFGGGARKQTKLTKKNKIIRRYNIPGSGGGSSTGPIVGGIIGAVIVIGAAGVGWYFWRKRKHSKNRNNAAFWDNEDIDGGKHSANPGIVATPFEWDGPSSNKTPGGSGGIHYGGVEGEQAAGSPLFAATQPLLGHASSSSPPWSASAHTTSFSGPSSSNNSSSNPNVYHNQLGAPMVGPKTHTSSGSSAEQRRSGLTGSTLVASNPDAGRGEKNPAMFAMEPLGGRRYDGSSGASSVPPVGGVGGPGMPQPPRPTSGPGPVDDAQLVDRIAHRLADIMTERVGVAGDEAPPSYVGADGEFYASPPPPSAAAPGRETSPASAGVTPSSYRPPQSTSPNPPPISPQYVQSPPSATSASGIPQLQPPTPPANSTSFGAAGAGRFGPRPRPSGSVSGRPGEYFPAPGAPTRSMSGSKDQSQSPRGPA